MSEPAALLEHHRRMLEIREFEDAVMRLFARNLVRGSTHLCQGQEAVTVGACSALREGDTMTCTYRGHGAVLAMGAPLDRAMAEILGKADGLCAGKGGSMHLTDVGIGALGSFADRRRPPAVLRAAPRSRRSTLATGAVSLCFFGDGSTNIGAFHEAMNLAVGLEAAGDRVRVREQPLRRVLADRDDDPGRAARRPGASYAMRAEQVDGNDVSAVQRAPSPPRASAARGGRRPDASSRR